MKKIILLSIISCSFLKIYAQANYQEDDGSLKTDNYMLIRPARFIKCTNSDGTDSVDMIEVPRNYYFQLVSQLDDGSAIVEFWKFTIPKYRKIYNYYYSSPGADSVKAFFRVRSKDWQNKVIKRYSTNPFGHDKKFFAGTTFTGGVIILPYKFRPKIYDRGEHKGFDFSKDITLGISGGIRQRVSHYQPHYIDLLLNVGISSVGQNTYNTDSVLKSNQDIAALTIACGLVLDMQKIQLGIFIGWDRVSDSNRNGWIYQGRPWLSIGFGYSIFSINTNSATSSQGQNSPN